MAKADWAALLAEGDFPAARAAWEKKFAGREGSFEASWDLAEVEERWGDSLFFGAKSGAAAHFHACCVALFPLGTQFSSREENDRRMEAHHRVMNKLYAIDSYGKARRGHDGQPHPHSCWNLPTPFLSFPEPRAATLQTRRTASLQQTQFAGLFHTGGHWLDRELGHKWRDAGEALGAVYPGGARRAYAWSLYYFERYNQAWTAHLPASRWDSDGGEDLTEVRNLADSLTKGVGEAPLPAWVEHLLAGDWQGAFSALGGHPPAPEFTPLAALLADACRAAMREDTPVNPA